MIVVCRVTTQCNLSCQYCAYDKTLPFIRNSISYEKMINLGSTLSHYMKLSGEDVLFSWLGGEPLLWKHIFEVSAVFKNDFGINVSATSNGTTLANKSVRQNIINQFLELTISIDGLEKFHNEVRIWQDGWQQLKESIELLSDEKMAAGSNLKLRVNTVLTHDNISQFEAMCFELAEWGVNEISFNQLGGRDRPDYFVSHRLNVTDAVEIQHIFTRLKPVLHNLGVTLCGSTHYLDRIIASSYDQPLAGTDCKPYTDFLFVDEWGRISPCSFTADANSIDADELKDGYDILRLADRGKNHGKSMFSHECLNCPSTHVFNKFLT